MTFDGRLISGVSVFVAVVDTGSFLKAGDELGLTKSGVSRAIARLEARMNLHLFNRGSRGVHLTNPGRLFYDRMSPLLANFKDAADEVTRGHNGVQGRIRVNCDATFGQMFLAPRLGELLRRHPDLAVDIVVTDKVGDLVAEGYDLAIRAGLPEGTSAEARRLMDMPLATCAAPSYLAQKGRPRSLDILFAGEYDLISLHDGSKSRKERWSYKCGDEVRRFEPPRRLLMSQPHAVLSSVIAGAGVARIPYFMVKSQIERGELIDLFAEWGTEALPTYICLPIRFPLSNTVRAFVAFIDEIAEDFDGANRSSPPESFSWTAGAEAVSGTIAMGHPVPAR